MDQKEIDNMKDFQTIKVYQKFYRELPKDLSNIDQETIDRIQELAEKAIAARDRLYEKNLHLVTIVVNKLHAKNNEREDLLNEGRMALFKAVEHFDPEKGKTFFSYATEQIRYKVLRYIYENDYVLNYPEEWHTTSKKIKAFVLDYQQIHGHVPSTDEIAEEFGKTPTYVKDVLNMTKNAIAFDPYTYEHDLQAQAQSLSKTLDPEKQMIEDMRIEAFFNAVSNLSVRDQEIIDILINSPDMILEEIGRKFDITPQRVSQIKNNSAKNIKTSMKNDVELAKMLHFIQSIKKVTKK